MRRSSIATAVMAVALSTSGCSIVFVRTYGWIVVSDCRGAERAYRESHATDTASADADFARADLVALSANGTALAAWSRRNPDRETHGVYAATLD